MKHDLKITYYLVALFFVTQLIGLFLLNQTISEIKTSDTGVITVRYEEPITGRPQMEGQDSFNYIMIMILVGTGLLLLLIKFRLFKVWKAWFFLAILGSLSISLSVFLSDGMSLLVSLVLTVWKIYKPNPIIHNFTEILIYSGIAILISPMFDVFWGIMLLVAISIYDAIAVWKSKHMITLAKAQTENKMFAGLVIPYKSEAMAKKDKVRVVKVQSKIPLSLDQKEVKTAILGGGDIAFPLLFAGSVMTYLIKAGLSSEMAYFKALLIPLFSGMALYLLFLKSEKGKFYPAMPFITAGCLIGYAVVMLL
ncbi:MAG: presenilin family intramembrane aspartyl protease [Candidatus Woesearchaeota archaeon]|nr:presenilin family intramembrane aspartyl protease [Candidatus Woesearchaeota archaeon]